VRSSKGDKDYIVTEHDGVWHCSCPHHSFRGVRCKHIARVQEEVEYTDTVGRDDPEDFDPESFFTDL